MSTPVSGAATAISPFSGAPASAAPSPGTPDVEVLVRRAPRVNLLPPEVVAGRRLKRAQKLLALALAAVVLLAAGAWLVASRSVTQAEQDVAAAQSRTAELTAEQARYAEVPVMVGQIEAGELALERALAGDVLWTGLLEQIDARYPDGIWLSELSVTLAPEASTGAPAPATDPLAEPAVATLSFEGTGATHDDVAAWLDTLTDVPGFSDARYTTSTRTDLDGTVVVQFSGSVGVTPDALSHRFDRKGASS